ncbi:hypothetical protein CK203_105238 [Vitis vinifera]|uniref:Uncharacterized protein n=1 Tax=Vitis vinifera TaxID=29760 RepID=A0A438C5H2_VITVI|nr:hypothetical protein CK203_105238 [Vitis vinifera]
MMASHLPRSLTAARRVMMALPPPRDIMTSQKVSLPLKREAELLTLYKDLHTRRKGQLNQNSILVESVRPFGSYVDHRDARPQQKEIPNNVQEALASPNWKKAVNEEMRALRVMEHGKLQSFQEKRRLWFVGGSLQ